MIQVPVFLQQGVVICLLLPVYLQVLGCSEGPPFQVTDPPALRSCGECESPSFPIQWLHFRELTAAAFSVPFGVFPSFCSWPFSQALPEGRLGWAELSGVGQEVSSCSCWKVPPCEHLPWGKQSLFLLLKNAYPAVLQSIAPPEGWAALGCRVGWSGLCLQDMGLCPRAVPGLL